MPPAPGEPFDELWWANPTLRQVLERDPGEALRAHGVNPPVGVPRAVVMDVVRIVYLMWVNGEIIPRDRFTIDPSDEGLLFGRGVWESTRTIGGVPWLWPAHIERLLHTAKLVNINIDPARLPDTRQVAEFVRAITMQDVVVRLNVTAGAPGKPGMVWMTAGLRPAPRNAIRLKTSPTPLAAAQPFLTWKTFQYHRRLQSGREVHQTGFDSALLLDPDGNILESAHANIFLKLPEGWATPSAASGLLLPGTLRRHLLEQSPIPMAENVVPATRLGEVQEAFLTNSNVGIVPVTQIDTHSYPLGPDTQQILRWLEPGAQG